MMIQVTPDEVSHVTTSVMRCGAGENTSQK